jgi:hypothetical protein
MHHYAASTIRVHARLIGLFFAEQPDGAASLTRENANSGFAPQLQRSGTE